MPYDKPQPKKPGYYRAMAMKTYPNAPTCYGEPQVVRVVKDGRKQVLEVLEAGSQVTSSIDAWAWGTPVKL